MGLSISPTSGRTLPLVKAQQGDQRGILKRLVTANHTHTWRWNTGPSTTCYQAHVLICPRGVIKKQWNMQNIWVCSVGSEPEQNQRREGLWGLPASASPAAMLSSSYFKLFKQCALKIGTYENNIYITWLMFEEYPSNIFLNILTICALSTFKSGCRLSCNIKYPHTLVQSRKHREEV